VIGLSDYWPRGERVANPGFDGLVPAQQEHRHSSMPTATRFLAFGLGAGRGPGRKSVCPRNGPGVGKKKHDWL
jgi:hypothetical protein